MSNAIISFQSIARFFFAKVQKINGAIRRRIFFLVRREGPSLAGNFFAADLEGGGEAYAPGAKNGVSGLSREETARFQDVGWVGPFSLLGPAGVQAACRLHDRVALNFTPPGRDVTKRPWFKSMHAYVPEYYDIARHPAIVNRVASLLGSDLMAWGLSMNLYYPGHTHPWHVDVEHQKWRGMTVFLGLKNITMKSALKVISCSHLVRETPDRLGVRDDASALEACRKYAKRAELETVPLKEGEFFIFDGRLWHGSKNMSFHCRYALILQYSPPDQRIEVPLEWSLPGRWSRIPPPCVLVKGQDRWGINRIVGRPE